MKMNWKIVYTGLAAALLLTACGTEGDPNKDSTPDQEAVDGSNGSSTDDSTAGESDTEVGSGSETDSTNSSDDDMANATLTKSDAQPFSMNVLPGYTLTSEEPGRDSLYADDNPSAFMRIETKLTEDGLYDYLLENMNEVLKASSDGKDPVELSDVYTSTEEGVTNVKAFTVETETGPVTGVLYEKDDMIVRLTIFDTQEAKYKADFLKMGETITN